MVAGSGVGGIEIGRRKDFGEVYGFIIWVVGRGGRGIEVGNGRSGGRIGSDGRRSQGFGRRNGWWNWGMDLA